jgi:phosphatidylglycerophosphatase A
MKRINEIILTFFFLGKAKKAPGTFGSIGALAFWFFLSQLFFNQQFSIKSQTIFWGFFLLTILLYGIFAIPFYAKKVGEIDHKSIVLDEVFGQILALQMTFVFISENYFQNPRLILAHLLFCFVLFRFFDIRKPLLIGYLDRNLKNSFGVMLDDVLCGLVVGLIGIATIHFFHA